MNNPNEILLSFEEDQNKNEIHQSLSDENSNKEIINDESQLNYFIFLFCEYLRSRQYKKVIREIDTLLNGQNIDELNNSWKVYILKIRAQLKVTKNKIEKYLISIDNKNMKQKYKINSIKRYLNQIMENLNIFVEKLTFIKEEIVEKIDNLLRCYFEYIYLYCIFNKKLGNTMNTISYLSYLLNLYKKTKLLFKSSKTLYQLENCFILLCQMLISNKDFISSINYIDTTIKICLNNLIYNIKDFSDGVFKDDKKKKITIELKKENDKDDSIFFKNELDIDVEKSYGDKNIKKIIQHLIILFYYRGICYENIGKINFSIKSYYQCIWFIKNFFYHSSEKMLPLFQNTLNKSLEFKKLLGYVKRKINFYDRMQFIWKKQYEIKENEEEKKGLVFSGVFSRNKLKKLENKILNLNIKEVDTINPFNVKKNIEETNGRKRDGIYKHIFLSDIRLLNSYLREDFKPIIDSMEKIRTLNIDLFEREKIQKCLRAIYFEEKAKKIQQKNRNNNIKFNRNNTANLHYNIFSKTSYIFPEESRNELRNVSDRMVNGFSDITIRNNKSNNERNLLSATSHRLTKISPNRNNYSKINLPMNVKRNLRAKSSILEQRLFSSKNKENRRIFSPISSKIKKLVSRNNKNILAQNNIKKIKYPSIDTYKKIRTQSAKLYKKIPTEDKNLNQFFSKQYLRKRKYIKNLEDRELKFQKCILKIKNDQNQNDLINKGTMIQRANELFDRVIGLHWTNTANFEKISLLDKKTKEKENLENSLISSLDKSPIIKYNIKKNKERNKRKPMTERMISHMKDVNLINNNIIKNFDKQLEEIKQREYIENKNYKEIINRDIKFKKINMELMEEIRLKNLNISPAHRRSSVFHYENKNKEHYFYDSNKNKI